MKINNLLNDKYVRILLIILCVIVVYSFLMNNRESFKLPKGIVIHTGRPNETRQNCTGKARTTCEKGKDGTVVCFNKCESIEEKLQRKREERDKKIEKLKWHERYYQKSVVIYEDVTKQISDMYTRAKNKIQGKTQLAK